MAPASRSNRHEEDYFGIKDRKTRKPLVEKKRRARINESLQELRLLLADPDAQVKMENAEVLEMTVKRVESILQNKAKGKKSCYQVSYRPAFKKHPESQRVYFGRDVTPLFSSAEADSADREANERFAAGYIQCMHEVHTFVSSCPGIDATIAADLLTTRIAFRTSCQISCRTLVTVALGLARRRTPRCRPETGAWSAAAPQSCPRPPPPPPAMTFALTWMTRTRSTAESRWTPGNKRQACQPCISPSPCGDLGRQMLLEIPADS
uniref:Hes family bHLH transcription factor 6 n=1 Tax=Sinocyclocheilus anshuiensis TaxID=1608454 RepID=A0A671R6J5_9TELE